MQEHEYKARDKTVRKMSRDGLTEENLRSGETAFVSQREREERILSKQEEKICFSRLEKVPERSEKKGKIQKYQPKEPLSAFRDPETGETDFTLSAEENRMESIETGTAGNGEA